MKVARKNGMTSAGFEKDRRRTRVGPGLKVLHRHQIGSEVSRRVSDLVFVNGRPQIMLEWIDIGGVRTPLFVCELDASKLIAVSGRTGAYVYEGVTVDPRFEELGRPSSAIHNEKDLGPKL